MQVQNQEYQCEELSDKTNNADAVEQNWAMITFAFLLLTMSIRPYCTGM